MIGKKRGNETRGEYDDQSDPRKNAHSSLPNPHPLTPGVLAREAYFSSRFEFVLAPNYPSNRDFLASHAWFEGVYHELKPYARWTRAGSESSLPGDPGHLGSTRSHPALQGSG